MKIFLRRLGYKFDGGLPSTLETGIPVIVHPISEGCGYPSADGALGVW